jgi:hypothetical protein
VRVRPVRRPRVGEQLGVVGVVRQQPWEDGSMRSGSFIGGSISAIPCGIPRGEAR